MKKILLLLLTATTLITMTQSCKTKGNQENTIEETVDTIGLSVRTAEQQAKLSPNEIVDLLKKGNRDFYSDSLTILNTSQRVRDAIPGQYPIAAILACSDSRMPVEDIFHMGIGDLFVTRVAGNIVNEDIIGSLEYSCKVLGSKVIVVLGHEYCGAIKSAIQDVKIGNITEVLNKIQPAIKNVSQKFAGEKTIKNPHYVEAVCDENVELSIENIRQNSTIISELEKEGKLMIIGGVYDIKTGKVDFFKY